MNFLTPLYIAGALAVALPILFHLIRRTPQQKQTFSSLMFLAPTPPRFTRRSRLSNILLLLLRAAAITLLALAFARPFFRESAAASQNQAPGSRIAILVDTSASMKRSDLWSQAQKQVDEALEKVTPADEVSLFFFDRNVRAAFKFEQWNRLDPSQRAAAIRAQLTTTEPTWSSTNLGPALATVADRLAATEGTESTDIYLRRKLILISDLQQGSHAEALQGHQWPESVVLEVRPVATDGTSNAGMQLIRVQPDSPDAADDRPRLRVTNSSGSSVEQFAVTWANDKGPIPTTQPQKVYVPPGRGQVVRIDWPPEDQLADRLLLAGDTDAFDNTLYVVPPRQETVRVVYVGDDAIDDPQGLAFYLHSALGETPQRRIEFIERRADPITPVDLVGTGLVVLTKPIPDDQIDLVRKHVDAGGEALWVILDPAAAPSLSRLTGVAGIEIAESPARDFALVSRVDLEHPLFSAFADARFSDFSRVHFWKHRTIKLPEASDAKNGAKTIASFENGDPFLIQKLIGKGRLTIATSGWHPRDSQLALSTKFVPLVTGLLQPLDANVIESNYSVGDAIPTGSVNDQKWTLSTPDGRQIDLSGTSPAADAIDRPGIYTVNAGQRKFAVAINVQPDESRTTPLSPADFKQWGAKFESAEPSASIEDQQRQLKYFELENRQKMWQWLLVGVLGLIAAETALAGRMAKRSLAAPGGASTSEQVTS